MASRPIGVALALLAAIAIVTGALLLTTGGEDRRLSPDEYRKELTTAFGDVRLDANPAHGGALQDYADQLRDLARELEDVAPPADAAPAHAKLVAGLEEYAGQLESLADSGRKGAIGFQQQLAETGGIPGNAWVEAFNDLAARGYLTYQPR
jgi:hypothetical protein